MATTYVLEYDGGEFSAEISPRRDITEFAQTLTRFNGVNQWGLVLWAVPDGVDYDTMRAKGQRPKAFIQAGGSADAMTVQIRKPCTPRTADDAVSILYVVGHPHDGDPPVDVPIPLGTGGAEIVSASEVFGADEAAAMFYAYYKTGDIPAHYTLRPFIGWTSGGTYIDYRGSATGL